MGGGSGGGGGGGGLKGRKKVPGSGSREQIVERGGVDRGTVGPESSRGNRYQMGLDWWIRCRVRVWPGGV